MDSSLENNCQEIISFELKIYQVKTSLIFFIILIADFIFI